MGYPLAEFMLPIIGMAIFAVLIGLIVFCFTEMAKTK